MRQVRRMAGPSFSSSSNMPSFKSNLRSPGVARNGERQLRRDRAEVVQLESFPEATWRMPGRRWADVGPTIRASSIPGLIRSRFAEGCQTRPKVQGTRSSSRQRLAARQPTRNCAPAAYAAVQRAAGRRTVRPIARAFRRMHARTRARARAARAARAKRGPPGRLERANEGLVDDHEGSSRAESTPSTPSARSRNCAPGIGDARNPPAAQTCAPRHRPHRSNGHNRTPRTKGRGVGGNGARLRCPALSNSPQ